MEQQQVTINDILSLEAYFRAGLDCATGLRRKLEHSTAPASPQRGFSADARAELHNRRLKTILKHKK